MGNFVKVRNSFRNALIYDSTYVEALNDLAMIYLVPEFDGHDISRAKSLHQNALNLTDQKKEEGRRQKLIDVFEKRMSNLNLNT